MDLHELSVGNMYIRAEDGIIEFFDRLILGSLRLPLPWVGVEVRPGRHDKVQLNFGLADPIGPVMYGQSLRVMTGPWGVSVDTAEEAQFRAFFVTVAPLVGRQVEP